MADEESIDFAASQLHDYGGTYGLWPCYETNTYGGDTCRCRLDIERILVWLEEGTPNNG